MCFVKTGLSVHSVHVKVSTCERDFDGIRNATVGDDYTAYNATETFTVDDTLMCATIRIGNDSVQEELEVFGVCLTQVEEDVLIGRNDTVQVIIRDDDGEYCV